MSAAQAEHSPGKLTLWDTCAMAIGGMVGGGVFSVIGEAAGLTGRSAWISFLIAAPLAMITGFSYSRLTVQNDQPGAGFLFLTSVTSLRLAATLIWFMILGYVFTNAFYATAFGDYMARLVGLDGGRSSSYFAAGIIAVMAALNLLGVRAPGLAQSILVYVTIAILLMVIGMGFYLTKPHFAALTLDFHTLTLLETAAFTFVAYEGFELLVFAYSDIQDRRRNLPHAMAIAIGVSMIIYVLIAFGTTSSLKLGFINVHRETVLAYLAHSAAGEGGFIAVLVAAVLSTSSAINATMFASSRVAKHVADHGQFPRTLTAWQVGGVPAVFILAMSAASIVLVLFVNLHQIIAFSSLVFLGTFAIVNMVAVISRSYDGWKIIFPIIGVIGCVSAIGILTLELYATKIESLAIIIGIGVVLVFLRLLYLFWYHCCVPRR